MGRELICPLVLIDDARLPGKKVGSHPLLVALPLQLPAGIENPALGRDFAPVIQTLAPIIQEPILIQFANRFELFLQISDKSSLYVGIRGEPGRRLVINLPANHRRIFFVMLQQFTNNAFTVLAIYRIH